MKGLLAPLGLLLVLGGLTWACAPATAPPTPTAAPDAFAVVRATSQAAYQTGKALLDRGDPASLVQGCTFIDTAKTNDPDNRTEIQQALDQCLAALSAQLATNAPTAAATLRPLVLPTVPAGTPRPTPQATAPPAAAAATSTPAQAAAASTLTPAPAAAASTSRPATAAAASTSTQAPAAAASTATLAPAPSGNLAVWRDPQGRFSIAAPADWSRDEQPQALFGTGVVGFHDPGGRAEMDVAVDSSNRAVSPELYAATMELAMNQQVPGYAAEQMQPGTTAGNPSIRRVFTFTMRDASGRELQARGFQIAVLKGSTPYIISGSAPAEQFQQFSSTFDRVVQSFQFS
jgi:hypothetical protein